MCLGIPARVLELHGVSATVDCLGVRRETRLDLFDGPLQPGDYVMSQNGFAVRKIPAEEVPETLALFELLLEQANGNRSTEI